MDAGQQPQQPQQATTDDASQWQSWCDQSAGSDHWLDTSQNYYSGDDQWFDWSESMGYVSWWAQAPEPNKESRIKPRSTREAEEYSQSAALGFYAGPSKKRPHADTHYGTCFAAYEHPIDVVSKTVQYSFTVKEDIPNLHQPSGYLSFSAAERLIDLESNPSYVTDDIGCTRAMGSRYAVDKLQQALERLSATFEWRKCNTK